MSKFAPVTASLLARKGDAMPSALPPPKQPIAWSPPVSHERFQWTPPESVSAQHDVHHESKPQDHHDKPRRLFVALSHAEHERLAIAAVKKNTTQHQIVHAALDAYFEKLAGELEGGCACIAGGACACKPG